MEGELEASVEEVMVCYRDFLCHDPGHTFSIIDMIKWEGMRGSGWRTVGRKVIKRAYDRHGMLIGHVFSESRRVISCVCAR